MNINKLILSLLLFSLLGGYGNKDNVSKQNSNLNSKQNVTKSNKKTFKIITYNVWYVFNEKKKIKEGQQWLKKQNADVVALQELTSIQPKYLTKLAKGWGHQYSALLKQSGFSVGITAKNPIDIIEKKIQGMHHGYLHVKISEIHFFIVHLSPFQYKMRRKEAKILVSKIKPLMKKKQPVVILGDFNAVTFYDKNLLAQQPKLIGNIKKTDDKYSYVQNLRNGKIDFTAMKVFCRAGLFDVVKDKLPFKANVLFTYPTGVFKDKKTSPKYGERIDHILTGPLLKNKVISADIPKGGGLNAISDHYPVIVELEDLQYN